MENLQWFGLVAFGLALFMHYRRNDKVRNASALVASVLYLAWGLGTETASSVAIVATAFGAVYAGMVYSDIREWLGD